MTSLKALSGQEFYYTHIVGTGGIGSGILFLMNGDHTLGRNESRMAKLLPCKDFCKQHIILHYISVLLGAKKGNFQTYPIGRVGNDRIGIELAEMMKDVGMNTNYISISDEGSTLFSVCYQYPDNTGGNITTENSACSEVSPTDISTFFGVEKLEGTKEIILAAPEVPLGARIKLLEYGRRRKGFNIASVLSSEAQSFKGLGGFEMVDMLSINIDEAKSIAYGGIEISDHQAIIDACIQTLVNINPTISVLITNGPYGSYCFHDNYLEHTPAPSVPVISTAGAGDAFLSGTITGLCCGLPLTKGRNDKNFSETPLASAVELGGLLASLSVTSQDTIHTTADAKALYEFAMKNDIRFGREFKKIFEDCAGQGLHKATSN